MVFQRFREFANNKRLLWIAEEWHRYAPQLAEWAMERLVNRRDVWSQYTLRNGVIGVVQLPIKELRKMGTHMVTIKKLTRHFGGEAPNHLIGLHSISDHSTCKWFAVDVDLHNENIANADEVAAANFAACLNWADKLRAQGMDPMLMDSNGVGGYHVWVLLDKEYPLADTYDFADDLRSDWEELGLPRKPEIFPPKRAVAPDDLPYALRVPGRHHTRPFYSRLWNFDPMGENEWLEGAEAIEAMMATIPTKLPKIKTKRGAEKPAATRPKKTAKKTATGKVKPRVCVDLDGVLAEYDGWEGIEEIGKPLPGAKEFADDLAKVADIVIFSSRCSSEPGSRGAISTLTPGQARIHIVDWLEKNEIPYADVFMGEGKPRVAAFIDDRAINCRPQEDAGAYEQTITAVKQCFAEKPVPKNSPYGVGFLTGVPRKPGGMRAGVIFSLAMPGGGIRLLPCVTFPPIVFDGIIVGGGIAGLRFAAGGLVLALRAFVFTFTAVEPQPATLAAVNISRHIRYLIFFSLRLLRLWAFSRP